MNQVTFVDANFRDAMLGLPEDLRADFALTLLGISSNHEATSSDQDGYQRSAQITPEQARELMGKVDKKTVEFIRRALENETDGTAVIDWSEVKEITGVGNWAQFAKGRLGGLHRSLGSIIGQPRSILIVEGDGWVEDGKGDYSAGTLVIDGAAVTSLKAALGV